MDRQEAERTIRGRAAKAAFQGGVGYSEHKIECAIANLMGKAPPAEPKEEAPEETRRERMERLLCKDGDATGGMWM